MQKTVDYHYKFVFSNGSEKKFDIKLDAKTLGLIQTEKKVYPEWAELKCFKCPNCFLDEARNKFCPVAAGLADIIDSFKDSISYEEVDVSIETDARIYVKRTALQKGLSSLMGIYMVTGGCPVMVKLKPMVRFHLPFATIEETAYRVFSMYLLAQYFLRKHGKETDWELKNLVKIYDDIQTINKSFCKRLSHIKVEDASLNAVVILNTFADFVTFSVNENMLDSMEVLFEPYLNA